MVLENKLLRQDVRQVLKGKMKDKGKEEHRGYLRNPFNDIVIWIR